MATIATINNEGSFDHSVRVAINTNFTNLNAAVIGPNLALINDTNGNLSILVDATASAVNGLEVTNAATGSAVAVLPGGAGSDTNVGLTVESKGTGALILQPTAAGGTVVIGKADQTGAITLGSSSGTEVVNVGTGAGVSTVNLATVSVAGANLNVATAATGAGITDTVAISTGNAAATGVKVVNILTGTPGTSGNNRLTMGGGATSAVTVNAASTSYQGWNFITSAAGGANALVATLTNAAGASVTVAAGLAIILQTNQTLQAGANTLNVNGHGTDSIKKGSNPATDISAQASGAILHCVFNGTVWMVMGQ